MFYLYPSHLVILPCTKVNRNIIWAVSRNKLSSCPNSTEQQIKNWKIYRCVHMCLCRMYLIEGWWSKAAEQMIITTFSSGDPTEISSRHDCLGFLFFLLLTSQSQVLFDLYLQDTLNSWSLPETIMSEIRPKESSFGWKIPCFPQMSMYNVVESLLVKVAQCQLFRVHFWGCSHTHTEWFPGCLPLKSESYGSALLNSFTKIKSIRKKRRESPTNKIKIFLPSFEELSWLDCKLQL